ncbi:MAG: dTDP-4-amino-4,6-dideoxygalactose transaminase [Gammaproteobacteria bacterium]|nr:dTDP-4-amino-4,6-dideoxygalactose transaminase [Gammaproteobacteria bacterium]
MDEIPFNRPLLLGSEIDNIRLAHGKGQLAGNGFFTKRCEEWLVRNTDAAGALLTHSCTAALEMAALLCDLEPGDEVIMPSYTFVSTANAFVLRGAVPVFVDIRSDTLNIDETLIESAITARTKAIVVVHYAGVPCEMNAINDIASRHQLIVIEDAAQAILSTYHGKPAGALGDIAAFSFHETKNVISGEGGAIILKNRAHFERAEIIREKGTDRSRFFRGLVDKYTWVDVGSSFLPGEIIAAFLAAQLEKAEEITRQRLQIWHVYHDAFSEHQISGRVQRPVIPENCTHNGHLYYLLLEDLKDRQQFIARMNELGVKCVFHYVPLHSSPGGRRFGRIVGQLQNTDSLSERLVRLPLWIGLKAQQQRVIDAIVRTLKK